MLSLTKQVPAKYKILVVKMNVDLHIVIIYIMFLLKVVHLLIKFVHGHDTFVCEFVITIEMCCAKLYNIYSNPKKEYGFKWLITFLGLHENIND